MKRPKVIAFDAAYTIIRPCLDDFCHHARRHFGLTFTPDQLQKAELKARLCQGPPDSLKDADLPRPVALFSANLITELAPQCQESKPVVIEFLRDCAKTHGNWFRVPYDDVIPCFEALRQLGFRLGVISNAEGTLHNSISYLEYLLEAVVDSAIVGHEKPDPRIFRHAYELFRIKPDEMLFVGDSVRCDVHGALNAGSHAALLDRDWVITEPIPPWVPHYHTLTELVNSFCPPCD